MSIVEDIYFSLKRSLNLIGRSSKTKIMCGNWNKSLKIYTKLELNINRFYVNTEGKKHLNLIMRSYRVKMSLPKKSPTWRHFEWFLLLIFRLSFFFFILCSVYKWVKISVNCYNFFVRFLRELLMLSRDRTVN